MIAALTRDDTVPGAGVSGEARRAGAPPTLRTSMTSYYVCVRDAWQAPGVAQSGTSKDDV